MSNTSPFGSASHFANIGNWKAGRPTSNPRRPKAQFTVVTWKHNQVSCNNSWKTTTPWPDPLLLCIWQIFSAAATKGWAWCNHNAGLMERSALRKPKLLIGWMLGIPRKNGWNGFLKQTCPSNLVLHCVAFCKHAQLKGWPPRFQQQLKGWQTHVQLTVSNSSISAIARGFAAVTLHNWQHNHCVATNSDPLLLCIWQLFSAAATKGWAWCNHDLMQRWRNVRGSQEAQASGREWRLRFYKRHGFLKQTCPTHLLSAVHHILRTSAAERLANTRPTHCC